MDLSDTIAARSAQPSLQQTQENDRGVAPQTSPESAMFSHASAAMDGLFAQVYGENGPEARLAVASAVAAEGPSAYDRLKAEPEAFGTVTGERSQAARLGGALEALDYSQTVHAAQQAGRDPVGTSYGPGNMTGRPAEERAGQGPAGSEDPSARAVPSSRAEQTHDPRLPDPDVERAVATVRERLAGGVSHDDLEDIQRTLLGLTPANASAAFGELRAEELQGWGRELADSGRWSHYRGYDDGERGVLFDRLAQHLDGVQLARFAQALDATDGTDDNRRLGAAVGGHSSPEAKVDFVRGLIAERRNPHDGTVDRAFTAGDAAAVEMAVSGMGRDGARVGEALRGVGEQQLHAILKGEFVNENAGGVTGPRYGAEAAMQMLNGIAATGNAILMAEAFAVAADVMEQARPHNIVGSELGPGDNAELQVSSWAGAERDMRRGMTAILDADTNGVMEVLESEYPGSNMQREPAFTRYAESLLRDGDIGTLGRHMARLQRGDELDQTPRTRFGENTPGGNTPDQRENAARLGHAVGSVVAALDNRDASARDEAATISTLVGYLLPGPVADSVGRGLDGVASRSGQALSGTREDIETLVRPLDGTLRDDGLPRRYSNEIGREFEQAKGMALLNGTR